MYNQMNNLVTKFINFQINIFMLLGYDSFLQEADYSILARIKGRLGIKVDTDNYGEMYGLIRLKNRFFYESNKSFKKRIIARVRDVK